MILEIVKQAVKAKMVCKSESPLISEAEYVYACAHALNLLGKPAGQVQILRGGTTIAELREKLTPYFEGKRPDYKEQPQIYRLLSLLAGCRVEGEVSEEIRSLIDEIDG
ncbi:MAG: DUF3837 family protein [Lachnospiraceae bacterium]|jgi:hypothetical protein|nr:DUF3837 family protein [Lachnospiraceae bacterium]